MKKDAERIERLEVAFQLLCIMVIPEAREQLSEEEKKEAVASLIGQLQEMKQDLLNS